MISPIKVKSEFNELLSDIEAHSLTMLEIAKKYPNLKWCLVNNSVYNLKDFEHPGGNFIIEQINGMIYSLINNYFFLIF